MRTNHYVKVETMSECEEPLSDSALSQSQIDRLDKISNVLHEILSGNIPERIHIEQDPLDEIRQVADLVNRMALEAATVVECLRGLAAGKLDTEITSKSVQAQTLKQYQAMLKHMVWQTQQVAAGDYGQRVDFIGDFSSAFNTMVERLEHNRQEIARQMAELQRMATTDALTGFNNRRNFITLASQEFSRWKRSQQSFTLLMFDLDHFKLINDTYGHNAGDEVLKAIALTCRAILRESDIAARIGGEEFVILFPATQSPSSLLPAERLRKEVEAIEIQVGQHIVRFTLSAGIAQVHGSDLSIEDTLKRADSALYQAKENGRNRIFEVFMEEGRLRYVQRGA
jgi:diguanylate cyclase (GGDEF)-like protein